MLHKLSIHSKNKIVKKRRRRNMKDVYEELKKNLNWKERIVLRIFKKICIMFYRRGMLDCFNFYNNT